MTGWLIHERGTWDDPFFTNEKFTEREAWLWLRERACFEPNIINFKSKIIEVKRGQVPTSYRRLKDTWKWSNDRIRSFLIRLETHHRIGTETGQGFLIITICNYDKITNEEKKERTPIGTHNGTHIGTEIGANINKENNKTIFVDDCSAGNVEKFNQKIQEIHKWLENHFQNPVLYPTAPIVAWLAWGADFEIDIKPAAVNYKTKHPDNPPRSLKWLDEKIAASIQQRNAMMPKVQARASPRDYGQEATDKNDRILQELYRQLENETDSSDSDDNRPHDQNILTASTPQGQS